MKPVTLRPHEARRLADYGDVLIVRPVEPQPPSWVESVEYSCFTPLGAISGRGSFEDEGPAEIFVRCPFGRVGDECWGRESFAHRDDFDWKADLPKSLHYLHYKADYQGDLADEWHNYGGWRSASTMPKCLSRFPRLVVASVECRRIQSVTEDEAIRTGLAPAPYEKEVGGYSAEHVEAMCRDCIKRRGPDEWLVNGYCWFATLRRAEG